MTEVNPYDPLRQGIYGSHYGTSTIGVIVKSATVAILLAFTFIHYYQSLSTAFDALGSVASTNNLFCWYFFGGAAMLIMVNCIVDSIFFCILLRPSISFVMTVIVFLCGVIVSVVGWLALLVAVMR